MWQAMINQLDCFEIFNLMKTIAWGNYKRKRNTKHCTIYSWSELYNWFLTDISLEPSFWNIVFLVWSATLRILLSSLCHHTFNIFKTYLQVVWYLNSLTLICPRRHGFNWQRLWYWWNGWIDACRSQKSLIHKELQSSACSGCREHLRVGWALYSCGEGDWDCVCHVGCTI